MITPSPRSFSRRFFWLARRPITAMPLMLPLRHCHFHFHYITLASPLFSIIFIAYGIFHDCCFRWYFRRQIFHFIIDAADSLSFHYAAATPIITPHYYAAIAAIDIDAFFQLPLPPCRRCRFAITLLPLISPLCRHWLRCHYYFQRMIIDIIERWLSPLFRHWYCRHCFSLLIFWY